MLMLLIGLGALAEARPQMTGTHGMIRFIEITQLNLNIEGDASQLSHALPKEIKSEKELVFNTEAAVYRKYSDGSDISEMVAEENEGMKIMISEPDNILFTDLQEGTTVEQKEFMTRMFLVKGERPERSWKFTGNSQEILGYNCQEATTEEDSVRIKVWFTPAIPVPAGPAEFGGLPGMILLADVDNGERVLRAEEIRFEEPDPGLLQKPRKGKEISREDFRALVDEKMKEQGATAGEGRVMTIRITR